MTAIEKQRPTDITQSLYRSGIKTRSEFAGDEDSAAKYYKRFLDFVEMACPAPGPLVSLLDVGCGVGWSSYFFAKAGYKVTGIDLNPAAFEPPQSENLILQFGSALSLPFADNSFDIATIYQCLEHLPDPELALKEMLRVLKPGGTICVVGPNLVSPTYGLKMLCKEARAGQLKFRRTANMASHPYGNTVFETVFSCVRNSISIIRKLASRHAHFDMRVPDNIPPFHGDNDACYFCNPVDLIRFLAGEGCRITYKTFSGRPPLSYLFAGGTWIAATTAPETDDLKQAFEAMVAGPVRIDNTSRSASVGRRSKA